MNIYSDTSHSTLKYLKDTEANIDNLIIMTGDVNIRDSLWDPFFPHHSLFSNDLFIIVDPFNLDLSIPTNLIPTRHLDTQGVSNLVLDLMFLRSDSSELNRHTIHPSWQLTSDHAPLTITIAIEEEHVINTKFYLPKSSKQEEKFIKEVISAFKLLDITNLGNCESLEQTVNSLATSIKQAWKSNARRVKITKHSKIWWNDEYRRSLNIYREFRSLED